MPVCVNCGKSFESKRADARFCSSRCKMRAHRAVTDNGESPPVTDNPDSVTANPPEPVTDSEWVSPPPIGHTPDGAPYYAPGRFDSNPAYQARVRELSLSMPLVNARRYAAKELAGTAGTRAHPSERLRTHEAQRALQAQAAKALKTS